MHAREKKQSTIVYTYVYRTYTYTYVYLTYPLGQEKKDQKESQLSLSMVIFLPLYLFEFSNFPKQLNMPFITKGKITFQSNFTQHKYQDLFRFIYEKLPMNASLQRELILSLDFRQDSPQMSNSLYLFIQPAVSYFSAAHFNLKTLQITYK